KPVPPDLLLGVLMRHLAAIPAVGPASPSAGASLEDLTRRFVRGLSERLTRFREALAHQNRNELAALAHKLRGAAAMYGFDRLAEIVTQLHTATLENRDWSLLQGLMDQTILTVEQIQKRWL